MLQNLIRWFYCLDMEQAAGLVLAAAIGFLCLRRVFGEDRRWNWLVGLALVLCLGVVAFATLANRPGDLEGAPSLTLFHTYREAAETGNIEIYRSNFMNVLLFFPAGLLAASLLPGKWPAWVRILLVTAVLALLSAGIEGVQYAFSLGRVEIDDVLHNTLGALLGALMGSLGRPRPAEPEAPGGGEHITEESEL